MSPNLRRRRTALLATALAVPAGAAAATVAVSSDGPKPAPKALDVAVHDALTAKPAPGITARIRFTNDLIPSGQLAEGATSPLISGATGRLWAARDGRFRLELQSDAGDAQVVSDGRRLTVFDAKSNTLYRAALPTELGRGHGERGDEAAPSLADVRSGLAKLAGKATLSGAKPTTVAQQPAYTLSVSPKHDGGLLGAAAVAWDAVRGTPLRFALTAQGSAKPVLELEATDVDYGSVAAADLRPPRPQGAKVVDVAPPEPDAARHRGRRASVQGVDAVEAKVGFDLAAPPKLVGLPRKRVQLVDRGSSTGGRGALVVYGQGLGALAVLQQPAEAAQAKGRERDALAALPKVTIDGATGTELSTPLGTLLRFQRDGVSYTLVGSLPASAAEAAARSLR